MNTGVQPIQPTQPIQPIQPIQPVARIDALDVVRGVAVLGILLMNIRYMGAPFAGQSYPPMLGWTTADQVVWWTKWVCAEGTMRGLLSLLFGAGFVMMTVGKGDGARVADVYYRRNIWLVVFGIIHGYLLLWPGDILLLYGTAGLFLFPWRHWRARSLALAGACVIGVLVSISAFQYWDNAKAARRAEAAEAKQRAAVALTSDETQALERWQRRLSGMGPNAGAVRRETELRLGGVGDNLAAMYTWANQLNQPPEFFYWVLDSLAFLFLGAAFVKWGIIQGTRSVRFYLGLALAGYTVGVPIRIAQAWPLYAADFHVALYSGNIANQIGRTAVTFGHLAVLLLVLKSGVGRRLLHPFGQVGRLALSNYVAQTIICQWILFPGFAFGLFGRFGLAGLWTIVGAIAVFQIIASVIYLRWYRMGPLEWVLRRLSYGAPVAPVAPVAAGL
jgi:uncharacterized protein